MKVTPEIFDWFHNLNIITTEEPNFEQYRKNKFIPKNIISQMFLGKYMDMIIQPLQNEYNKFYNRDDNYTINLVNLKELPENQKYKTYAINNKIRYENWKIIFEILGHFGLYFTEAEINLLVNNDIDELEQVIKKIYHTFVKFSNIQTGNKNIKTKLSVLNIDKIDINKNYDDCKTLLEFIILSIAKNMNLNARQSVALLSNNRKYLKKICINGYIFDFQMIKNWLQDFELNKELILNLIINSDDGLNIFYETIGTLLYCKDLDISLQAARLLNLIKNKIRMNWKWFYHEGINNFNFIFNKENSYYKKDFLREFVNLISGKNYFFFDEIKKKFYNGERKLTYDLLSNIINTAKNMDTDFTYNLQIFIYEICLSKAHDISFNLSMLSDTFYNFIPTEEKLVQKILSYFQFYIKCNTQNIFSTGIIHLFTLMERLGKIKNKYAPQLYKIIVNLFLETYDSVLKREIFLENFEKFFNENQDIPIDIFLEPYLEKINNCQNYALYDFLFLLKIIEHPRIEGKDIFDIIKFILYVCLHSEIYTRCANLILSLIFEKNLITKNKNDEESFISYNLSEIENQFVNFITTALESYLSNIYKKEDKFLLETPYEIMSQNFEQVNIRVKNTIINGIKKYRKLIGTNANELLALLWHYDDHDDIMMKLEEINRPIYEPVEKILERKKLAKKEREAKSYTIRVINYLNNLSKKRWENAKKQEEKYELNIKREKKIKQKLSDYRNFIKFIPSFENGGGYPPLLVSNGKLKLTRNNSRILKNNNLLNNFQLKSGQNFDLNKTGLKLMKSQSQPEFSIYEKKDISNIIKQYKILVKSIQNKKYISIKTKGQWIKSVLIQKEDTCINQELYNKNRRYFLDKNIFIKYLFLPFDLDEEEDRELTAIKGYNNEYKKNLAFYFKNYSNEVKQKISKIKFIRLLRDIGFDRERIQFNEINILIRLMFKFNLSEFDFNQFINLLVQIAYILYYKFRPGLSIGEAYGNFIRRLTVDKINERQLDFLNRKYQEVFDYIFYLREQKEPFNMPEGFKIVKKTEVKYNYRLQTYMAEYIGEPRLVCYQIIEEIIFSVCQSSYIEPYIEVDHYETIELEPEKVHNWSAGLTMAYMDLDKDLQFHGLFAADALEDGIRKMLRKTHEENFEYNSLKYTKKPFNIKWAQEGLNKIRQKRGKILIENEKKKNDKEPEYNKFKSTMTKSLYDNVKNEFKNVQKKIKLKKIKKKEEIEAKQKLEIENIIKKKEESKSINKECGKKVRLQLLNIVEKKTGIRKEKLEEYNKQYTKYDKCIINSMKYKVERTDIKSVLNKYEKHLKLIFDSYSSMSSDKINPKKVIHLNEFNQFLNNFSVLDEYISLEQMNWIFNNISKASKTKRNNKLYLDFDDFKMSLCYLSIFLKLDKDIFKLNEKNVEEMSAENIDTFMKKIGLKIPFNKNALEKLINQKKSNINKLNKKDDDNKSRNKKEEKSNETSSIINNNKTKKKEEESEDEDEEEEEDEDEEKKNNKKEKSDEGSNGKKKTEESDESSSDEEEEESDDKKNSDKKKIEDKKKEEDSGSGDDEEEEEEDDDEEEK